MERDEKAIGAILRARRVKLRLRQDQIAGVSSATVRKIEAGQITGRSELSLSALLAALKWPDDALDHLMAGEDPSTIKEAGTRAVGGREWDTSGIAAALDELGKMTAAAFDSRDPAALTAVRRITRMLLLVVEQLERGVAALEQPERDADDNVTLLHPEPSEPLRQAADTGNPEEGEPPKVNRPSPEVEPE